MQESKHYQRNANPARRPGTKWPIGRVDKGISRAGITAVDSFEPVKHGDPVVAQSNSGEHQVARSMRIELKFYSRLAML